MHSGGKGAYVDSPDRLPKAKIILPVFATDTGYIERIDADICGSIARYIGAGRMNDENEIDNTAGLVLEKKIGDYVQVGEVVAYVHTNDSRKAEGAVKNLTDAFEYSPKPIHSRSRVMEIYGV